MIQVLFYGDRLTDGTRKWLLTIEFPEGARFTSRIYKNIVYNLEFLCDHFTDFKCARAYVFNGDKVALTIDTEVFDFDDEDVVIISVNTITTRCYTRKH